MEVNFSPIGRTPIRAQTTAGVATNGQSVDGHVALIGGQHGVQDSQKRGLPCPVGPKQTEHFAAGNLERHVIDRDIITVSRDARS